MATKSPYTNVTKEHYVHLKFTVTCHYLSNTNTYIHTYIPGLAKRRKKEPASSPFYFLIPYTCNFLGLVDYNFVLRQSPQKLSQCFEHSKHSINVS